jgi:hypothetical protein
MFVQIQTHRKCVDDLVLSPLPPLVSPISSPPPR